MKELSFKTNARHIGQLGRELVTDFVTALVELIKNAYDADAESAKISIQDTKNGLGRIVVADCGSGMTAEDFEQKWMVIGTSNKLSSPYTPKGRKKAGKKGIGRFSVERLAERVTIYSFPEQGYPFSVELDWNRYEELDLLAIKQRLDILAQRQDREAAKFISSQLQYATMLPTVDRQDKLSIEAGITGDIRNHRTFFAAENIAFLAEKVLPALERYEWHHQLVEEIKTPLIAIDRLEACEAYPILSGMCKKAGKDHVSGIVMALDGLRDEWTQRSVDKLQKELRLLVAPNFLEEDPFEIEFSAPEFRVDELVSVNDIIDAHFAKVSARISDDGKTSRVLYEDRNGTNVTYHSASCKMYLRHDFKHRCAYCGVIEEFMAPMPEIADKSFEKDHFSPQHDNPPALHEYPNLYYSCTRCNNKKDAITLPLDPCTDDIFSGEAPCLKGGTSDVNYVLSSESAKGNEYITSLGLNSRYHVAIRKEQEAWLRAHEESKRILQELQDKQVLDPEDLKLMALRLGISSHADSYTHICGGSEHAINFAEACHYLESNGYQPEIKFAENELDITVVIGGITYWGTVRISDTIKACHIKTAELCERKKVNAPYGIFTFVPETKTMYFHEIDFASVDPDKKEHRTSAYIKL